MASSSDFAGLIAAIAANADTFDKDMAPVYPDANEEDFDIDSINIEINNILHKQLCLNPTEASANLLDEEIFNAINLKFGHILQKDIDIIQEKREHLNNLIKKEEAELNLNYTDKQQKVLNELKNHAEQLRNEKLIIRKVERIKYLIKQRLNMYTKLKLSQNDNDKAKYIIYNNLRKDFISYNDKIEEISPKMPKITLNSTAFLLVNKWAKLNENSNNYIENWNNICQLLKESGCIKYEGDLFNAIAQTINFLNQLDGMLASAIKSGKYEDKENDFNQLRRNCNNAIKLLKAPPLYANEEL